MKDYCEECERSFDELCDLGIEVNDDGFCNECMARLMKEWKEEEKAMIRQWEQDRL